MELGKHDKVMYIRRNDGTKKGVMVATVEDKKVHIGFSLCCKSDSFDQELGKAIAFKRAPKFDDRVARHVTLKQKKSRNVLVSQVISELVPDSIHNDVKEFSRRCVKYYKDKTLPKWLDAIQL